MGLCGGLQGRWFGTVEVLVAHANQTGHGIVDVPTRLTVILTHEERAQALKDGIPLTHANRKARTEFRIVACDTTTRQGGARVIPASSVR